MPTRIRMVTRTRSARRIGENDRVLRLRLRLLRVLGFGISEF
jgi:hypothetical protein